MSATESIKIQNKRNESVKPCSIYNPWQAARSTALFAIAEFYSINSILHSPDPLEKANHAPVFHKDNVAVVNLALPCPAPLRYSTALTSEFSLTSLSARLLNKTRVWLILEWIPGIAVDTKESFNQGCTVCNGFINPLTAW